MNSLKSLFFIINSLIILSLILVLTLLSVLQKKWFILLIVVCNPEINQSVQDSALVPYVSAPMATCVSGSPYLISPQSHTVSDLFNWHFSATTYSPNILL